MEKIFEAINKSKKALRVADHMLFMTYPLVNDKKLLILIIDNIFLALTNAIASLLYYERYFKRIPPFHDNFESKFNMFVSKCVSKYNINKDYLDFIVSIKELVLSHRKSQIEFVKKDKLVICGENFKLTTLTVEDVKEKLLKAREFVMLIRNLINQDGKITI